MVLRSVCPVVLNRDLINRPRSKGIGCVAHCNVQVVLPIQILRGGRRSIQGEDNMEPALRVRIKVAGWISDGGAEREWRSGAIDGRGISIESVQIGHAQQ